MTEYDAEELDHDIVRNFFEGGDKGDRAYVQDSMCMAFLQTVSTDGEQMGVLKNLMKDVRAGRSYESLPSWLLQIFGFMNDGMSYDEAWEDVVTEPKRKAAQSEDRVELLRLQLDSLI